MSRLEIKKPKISNTYLRDHEMIFVTDYCLADEIYGSFLEFEKFRQDFNHVFEIMKDISKRSQEELKDKITKDSCNEKDSQNHRNENNDNDSDE